jgi:hypothetical protein
MSRRSTVGCVQNDLPAYGTFGANHSPSLRWDEHYLQRDWNELPLDPHLLGVRWGMPKMICEPKEHRHKPCTFIALRLTLSPNGPKQASTWAMSRRSTIECAKWFTSLWYIRRKPSTYLATRLTQSPNRQKWASSWPTSQRSSIECTQNIFRAYFTFSAKHRAYYTFSAKQCTYLASR